MDSAIIGLANKGVIGQGAFGRVYLVENKDGEQFAVKEIEWGYAGRSDRQMVENELDLLKDLSHEHLLSYVDHFQSKGYMYVITEYCSGGDLSGFLDEASEGLPEDLILVWLWQMACGLEYMHKHENGPILHRDLKPGNVFLSETGSVRLGDVGIARKLAAPDAMAETFCGTPPYMSPEALTEKPYNTKTDIWSLGCCVTEMATLERAYNASTLFLLRNAVLSTRQSLPRGYSRALDNLVAKMLKKDFWDRVTATEVLDSALLVGCEAVEPMDLLLKHKLHTALAMHRRRSPPTTTTTTIVLSTIGGPDEAADATVHTLRESMSNLRRILDGGETMRLYRVKIDNRMRGRRPDDDDDTLTSSSSLQTVLYKPASTVKHKTSKKKLKVPTVKVERPSPAAAAQKERFPRQEPDDSLSRSVRSTMTSLVESTIRHKPRPASGDTPQAEAAAAYRPPSGKQDTARPIQMAELQRALVQVVGGGSLREASSIVRTATSRDELMTSLSSVLGDSTLTFVVIYFMLMESANVTSSDS